MKRFSLLSIILLAILSPLACSKTFTLAPLPAPTVTPTPTATFTAVPTCCVNCQTVTCTSGITWGYGYVVNELNLGVNQYSATLAISVSCLPETTDAVTVIGPGLNLPLTYVNNVAIGSTNYALYESGAVNGSLTTGASYTMTSITSIGTASASLAMCQSPSVATNGEVTYTEPSYFVNFFEYVLGQMLPTVGTCFYHPSPLLMNVVTAPQGGANGYNYTLSITGGSGIFYVSNGEIVTWT